MLKTDLKAQMQQYLSGHHVPPIALLYLAQAQALEKNRYCIRSSSDDIKWWKSLVFKVFLIFPEDQMFTSVELKKKVLSVISCFLWLEVLLQFCVVWNITQFCVKLFPSFRRPFPQNAPFWSIALFFALLSFLPDDLFHFHLGKVIGVWQHQHLQYLVDTKWCLCQKRRGQNISEVDLPECVTSYWASPVCMSHVPFSSIIGTHAHMHRAFILMVVVFQHLLT